MIGLERMGANLAPRLPRGRDSRNRQSALVYDRSVDAISVPVAAGASGEHDPAECIAKLPRFLSREDESFNADMIAALPNVFRAHAVKPETAGVR